MMKKLKKGDWVMVWDLNTALFGEMAEVQGYEAKNNQYIVALYDGLLFAIQEQLVTKILSREESKQLEREFFIQLVDLSLDLRDEKWFDELIRRLGK